MNRPFGNHGHRLAALLAVAAVAGRAIAQEPLAVPPTAPFVVRSWSSNNGLAQNSVTRVAQSKDGMVWVATFGGLCRFDGRDWTVFDAATTPGFSDSRITALAVGADGAVWCGSELGIVSRFDGFAFRRVAAGKSGLIRHLETLPDGRMLCCDEQTVHWLTPAGLGERLVVRQDANVASVGRDGGEVLVGGGQGLDCVRNGVVNEGATVPMQAMSRAADGRVWLGTENGVACWREGKWETAPDRVAEAVGTMPVRAILQSRSGLLWVGSDRALICIDPQGQRAPVHMRASSSVRCLFEDVDGGVWVGMIGSGVVRLSGSEAEGVALFDQEGRPQGANSVIDDGRGGFWVGAARGLFHVHDGVVRREESVAARGVYGLFRETDGSLWVGQTGVVTRLRDGRAERHEIAPECDAVRAIARDGRGRMLLGTEDGVWVLSATCEPLAGAAVLRGHSVKLIQCHADGIWLVGARGVVELARDDAMRVHWQSGVHLPLADVRAVLPSPTGRVWMATYGSGFVGMRDGVAVQISLAEGLAEAYLCTAAAHPRGWLIGGNRGPFLVDPASLDRVADGTDQRVVCRPIAHNAAIAAEANGGVQPGVAVAAGGAAIASVGGVWLIRDDQLRDDTSLPVCSVTPLVSGAQSFESDAEGVVVRVCDDRTVVVACASPEFESPTRVVFRWRFAGGEWSEPTARSAVSVAVPRSGLSVVEFIATGAHGKSSMPVTLRIVAEPFLWERGWFPWSLALGLGIAAFAAFRFGSRRSARQAEYLRELVDARTSELTLARDSLEQRVAMRTNELQRALEQLERDHEQRAHLERELQQMRRMESLGQLAGSVAHDFNNLLTVVIGNVQMLELEISANASVGDLLRRILEASARGRDLTQRLLAVASRQAVAPAVLDVAAILRAQLGVLRDLMGGAVKVELEIRGEPLRVRAAAGQIDQIVMNLAVNARAAMPNGGTFSLRASHGGDVVQLEVTDNGVGMSADVVQRAFEPFFTTRVGSGTGLGLATVYGITKQLGGDVALESEPGRGTSFTFSFPLIQGTEPSVRRDEPAVLVPRPPAASERRRVLLVEDEPDVRRAMRMLLETWGCAVVAEAGHGNEAVRMLTESGIAVDVVVSDVRMPGLHGIDLVRSLRAIRAALPIVFVSGHTSSASFVAELAPLGIELIAKPPARAELLAALDRAMVGTRTGAR